MTPVEQEDQPGRSDAHPILLVAAPWKERAYLLAELQERGYEVRAVPGIHHAIGYLIRRPHVKPALVLLDVTDDPDLSPRTLRDLLALSAPSPWIVLTSATRALPDPSLLKEARVHVLRRPVAVGDVVARVEALLQARARNTP